MLFKEKKAKEYFDVSGFVLFPIVFKLHFLFLPATHCLFSSQLSSFTFVSVIFGVTGMVIPLLFFWGKFLEYPTLFSLSSLSAFIFWAFNCLLRKFSIVLLSAFLLGDREVWVPFLGSGDFEWRRGEKETWLIGWNVQLSRTLCSLISLELSSFLALSCIHSMFLW